MTQKTLDTQEEEKPLTEWEQIFMTQKTLDTQEEEKPLTEWEQIVLKLIDGKVKIIEETRLTIEFNYNNQKCTIWIGNRDIPSAFGILYEINGNTVAEVIRNKTKIRPEIQEKLKVFAKLTDNDILQEFEQKHFKL